MFSYGGHLASPAPQTCTDMSLSSEGLNCSDVVPGATILSSRAGSRVDDYWRRLFKHPSMSSCPSNEFGTVLGCVCIFDRGFGNTAMIIILICRDIIQVFATTPKAMFG